ncbi:APC family permease [Microbulbifer hainanensis]|uniref:APC family permease n=1 Tax=Microbulbifer hainanensis TaxID=2735675 RepID=UPI00186633EC|nr:APC family permease [Microbulbifer hainanensis]
MTTEVLSPAGDRASDKPLGLLELVAIAVGGMVGGGIFAILGVSASMIGAYTPVAIALGGGIAALAAYSYIKLGVYYRDEGAMFSFYQRTFPNKPFAAALIGWWVSFGYISTLALYAYTFASYAISGFEFADSEWARKLIACAVVLLFTLLNLWSVKGMGKVEDLMVYAKLVILAIIAALLLNHREFTVPQLLHDNASPGLWPVVVVASLTFVAYEGFQLVLNAVNEMDRPGRNIPLSIYIAIALVIAIYVIIALGAMLAVPFQDLIRNKEYALASAAAEMVGSWGTLLVVVGALLATSSAISGTIFGASRQMAVVAEQGYFPAALANRSAHIPVPAIWVMFASACALILAGSLQVILEFGSVTFLLVSLLMAYANFRIREKTGSSTLVTLMALAGLLVGTFSLFYYEATSQIEQMYFIAGLYLLLALGAWGCARHTDRAVTG